MRLESSPISSPTNRTVRLSSHLKLKPGFNEADRGACAAEVARHIGDCLQALPESRRRVAVLYLQGHGATEISALLGEEYKRIENLVYRALAALRKCLLGKGVSPVSPP